MLKDIFTTSKMIIFPPLMMQPSMSNYENGGYRPHYFAIKDSGNPDIFWMVPVSSQYGKYKALHDKMAAKYRRCTKIVLGKCGGKDAAYLTLRWY